MITSAPSEDLKFDFVATPSAPDFTTRWESLQFLSDRFGEIDRDPNGDTPERARLLADEQLASQLGWQIWGETGFIAFLEGQYGVLFEGEFPVLESDGHDKEFEGLRPRSEVIAEVLERIPALEAAFPGVRFAVPHHDALIEQRTGLWAFVPDGLIKETSERRRLGNAVLELGRLEP